MKTLLSWSSGKDSAWSLYTLQQNPDIELCGLFTTINEEFDRVAMHGVRKTILEQQAKCAELPLSVIPLPNPCPNEIYEQRMAEFIKETKQKNIKAMAFGDLFLEDIRNYRIKNMENTGIEPIFPIWGENTKDLASKMIASGVKAHLTCVDSKQIDPSFSGRAFDQSLLNDLPDSADPCGENGEFHTVVYAGPMFKNEIPLKKGETLNREGFIFTDFSLNN